MIKKSILLVLLALSVNASADWREDLADYELVGDIQCYAQLKEFPHLRSIRLENIKKWWGYKSQEQQKAILTGIKEMTIQFEKNSMDLMVGLCVANTALIYLDQK